MERERLPTFHLWKTLWVHVEIKLWNILLLQHYICSRSAFWKSKSISVQIEWYNTYIYRLVAHFTCTTHLHDTSIRDDNNNSNILQYNMNILNTSIIMYTTCRKSIIYLHVNPVTLFYITLLSCVRGPLLPL